jgi:ABC-type Na+ efflux pump permease subunit
MDAMDDFYLGRIDGVLFVPAEDEIIELELWLPKNDIRGTLLLVALKPKLENFEESVRTEKSPHLAEKISIPSKGYRSSFFELTYTLLLPLLIFLPSILSGALCIDIITREFEDKTIESLLVTPLSLWEVVKGKILAAWIIAPPQATLWISLFLINGILVHNPLLLILLSAFIAMLLVVAAAFLSLFLRERTSTQFFYSLILIIFFTLSFSLMDSPVGMSVRIALGKESPLLPLYGILALAGYLLLRRFSENFDPF